MLLMATLALGTLLTVLDSVAKQVELFETAVGLTGAEANTVAKGAANNVATVQAVGDPQVLADLMAVVVARAEVVKAGALERGLVGPALQRALDRHYGTSPGSLNLFLTAQNARVHPLLRRIGCQIDALNAFMPTALDPVASFAVTGAGVGTFTAGGVIDATNFGPAHMRVRADTVIGATPIDATCTMTRVDGGTEPRLVTIPNGTAIGVQFDVGAISDRYLGCVGITIAGGTSGDAFTVLSQIERVIAL